MATPVYHMTISSTDSVIGSPHLSEDTLNNIKQIDSKGVPLQTAWTFWLDKTSRGVSAQEYEASLRKVYTVHTVQSFWSVYHNIPTVGDLPPWYSYHLMREDVRPVWEDEVNLNGGTWRLKCFKKDTSEVWEEILLAAIGEQFSESIMKGDEICGVSVSMRERDFDVIQIWNVDSSKAEKATVIDKVKSVLPDVIFEAEFYKPHCSHQAFRGMK